MSTPSDDDTDPELRKYAPKWARERPTATDVERRQYVNLPKEYYQDRRIRTLSPGPVPEPVQQKDGFTGAGGPLCEAGCICGSRRIVGHLWEIAIATCRGGRGRFTSHTSLQTSWPSTYRKRRARERSGRGDCGSPRCGAVRNCADTASAALTGAGAASRALSDLETARTREQRQQCRSRGNRQ